MSGLTAPDSTRFYSRQMRLKGFGPEGQRRLAASSVAIVGAGALGCPVATYVVAAGVGRVRIIDGDCVEESNLHRQVAFRKEHIGQPKAPILASTLSGAYPGVKVAGVARNLEPHTPFLLDDVDLVLDCTDTFSARYSIHDLVRERGLELVQGAVQAFCGTVTTFAFSRGDPGCLRCLWSEAPEDGCVGSCAEDGVLGATAGVIGAYMAQESLRYLSGLSPLRHGVHTAIDLEDPEVLSTDIVPRRDCACRDRRPPYPRPRESHDEHEVEPAPESESSGTPTVIDLRRTEELRPEDDIFFPDRVHIPFDTLVGWIGKLDPHASYLVVCEHGVRSAIGMEFLREKGFTSVSHVAGGFEGLRDRIRG